MRKYSVLMAATLLMSFGAQAEGSRQIECKFTEPSYDLRLDLEEATLVQRVPDFSQGQLRIIETQLFENLWLNFEQDGTVMRIAASAEEHSDPVLSLVMDYSGNNGMSDRIYPMDAFHFKGGMAEHRRPQQGGCTLGELGGYDPSAMTQQEIDFAVNASAANSLCFARAVGGWTAAPSSFVEESTVFWVLYGMQVHAIPPGEPGEVSSSFSSNERDELFDSALLTKIPPQDGGEYNRLRASMWDHCYGYSTRLRTRYGN